MTLAKHFGPNLYTMELHEKENIEYRTGEEDYDHGMLEVIRVPGGWLYRRHWKTGEPIEPMVFVPFDNEFMPR